MASGIGEQGLGMASGGPCSAPWANASCGKKASARTSAATLARRLRRERARSADIHIAKEATRKVFARCPWNDTDKDELKDRLEKVGASLLLHWRLDETMGRHWHRLGDALRAAQKAVGTDLNLDQASLAAFRAVQLDGNAARHEPRGAHVWNVHAPLFVPSQGHHHCHYEEPGIEEAAAFTSASVEKDEEPQFSHSMGPTTQKVVTHQAQPAGAADEEDAEAHRQVPVVQGDHCQVCPPHQPQKAQESTAAQQSDVTLAQPDKYPTEQADENDTTSEPTREEMHSSRANSWMKIRHLNRCYPSGKKARRNFNHDWADCPACRSHLFEEHMHAYRDD